MKVTYDIKRLKKLGISPTEYTILYFIINNMDIKHIVFDSSVLKNLEDKSFIKRIGEKSIIMRQKGEDLFLADTVQDWIDEYRERFKGARSTTPMGDKQRCIKNLEWFVTTYPQYTKQDILSSVDRYLNSRRMQGIPVRQADFFIKKQIIDDGAKVTVSDLLSTLEDTDNRTEVSKDNDYESI